MQIYIYVIYIYVIHYIYTHHALIEPLSESFKAPQRVLAFGPFSFIPPGFVNFVVTSAMGWERIMELINKCGITIWLFNIAMENHHAFNR